jgi:hypothetical protein
MSDSLENRRSLLEETGDLQNPDVLLPAIETPPPQEMSRELIALTAVVILCDIAIYRSYGYAGPGVMLLLTPWLLCVGIAAVRFNKSFWLLVPLLVLVSLRLIWCGSGLAVAMGFGLLICISMSLIGLPPWLAEAVYYFFHLIWAGLRGLFSYFNALSRFGPTILTRHWFAVLLPAVTLAVFGTIFILANPDLVKSVVDKLVHLAESLDEWLRQFQFSEVLFCVAAAWIGMGALRPDAKRLTFAENVIELPGESAASPFYSAYRNTLVSLIVLFAVYLTFEFKTLWFKKFPQGFYYSGYAHEGAAWLTIALGLATVVLSIMFRGSILSDPRLSRLRVLSSIWSIENLLLAVAVFNRLFIYIGFNGMTRMRVVGMLGVASVVGGFVLVLRKIARNQDFLWLIRRQLWTVALAAYLYAVLPVDAFVNWFNVSRIMKGDFAPCVQISVHPTTDEGFLFLSPLLECSNEIIREGVTGLLEEKQQELQSMMQTTAGTDWTAKQFARTQLVKQLETVLSKSQDPKTSRQRENAIERFHKYAYQWY